jgi:predicted ABC-type ATPase
MRMPAGIIKKSRPVFDPGLGRHSLKKSRLYVIAGPNGSGKTTFAQKFLPHFVDCFEFVNADMIARDLSPKAPEKVALKAGKLLLARIETLSKSKTDFAFETTLAGRNYHTLFRKISRRGYELHLIFLWIPDVGLALARIRDRVRQGGHNIPEADVRRRFKRGLVHFFHYYQFLFSHWSIYDSSTVRPAQIVSFEKGCLRVYNKARFQAVRKMGHTL